MTPFYRDKIEPVRLTANALAALGKQKKSTLGDWHDAKDPYERFRTTGQVSSPHQKEIEAKKYQRQIEAR